VPVLQSNYEDFRNPPGVPPKSPATDVVVCGVHVDGTPFIVEVDQNCNAGVVQRDWHAIGSGAGFAQLAGALLQHLGIEGQSIETGKLIVFRAISAVITTSHWGVGGDVQMWQVTGEGARQLEPSELATLGERLKAWKEIEQDGLGQVMGEGSAEEAPMPPPVPDDSPVTGSSPDDGAAQ
jgi:hypothetical protein